jgi:ABC-type glycerol-3-phosphate transport system permease component
MTHNDASASIGLNQAALARKKIFNTVRFVIAVVFCIISIFPLYWMLVTSFKTQAEVLLTIPTFWPREWHFENYPHVFRLGNFARYYVNTAAMTAAVLFLKTITGVLAAYGFSKGKFRGQNVLFMIVLGAMMVPIQVTFISIYIMCARWHIVDTFAALVLPEAVSSSFIFLLRQNFMAVDDS